MVYNVSFWVAPKLYGGRLYGGGLYGEILPNYDSTAQSLHFENNSTLVYKIPYRRARAQPLGRVRRASKGILHTNSTLES